MVFQGKLYVPMRWNFFDEAHDKTDTLYNVTFKKVLELTYLRSFGPNFPLLSGQSAISTGTFEPLRPFKYGRVFHQFFPVMEELTGRARLPCLALLSFHALWSSLVVSPFSGQTLWSLWSFGTLYSTKHNTQIAESLPPTLAE
jgi:hypothetical protein